MTTFTGAWLDRAMGNMEWNFMFEEATITRVAEQMAIKRTVGLLKLEKMKKRQTELDTTLFQEELLWYQRYREEQKVYKFYQASTMVRNRRKKIAGLRNTEGAWISDADHQEKMVFLFYANLYTQ